MTTISKLLIILVFLSSCGKSYKIYSDKLKSSEEIKNGFYLSQIIVSSFDKKGRPSKYSEAVTIFCGPNPRFSGYSGNVIYNDVEKKILSDAWKNMDSIAKINGNKIGGPGHEIGIDLYFQNERTRDSIEKIHFPFVAKKTIYFNQPNEYYKWMYCVKKGEFENVLEYSKGLFDKIPIEFKVDQWYMINFSNATNIIDKVFFYIDRKGAIHQYNHYKVLWG